MLSVSAAWDELAVELGSAARSFSSVTSGLAGEAWQGAASAAMVSTSARYAGALTAAATQAQATAVQARTVASAFESALAATIHPALVSANRNQLVRLVVSNLFGQNAPAIAAAEADYEHMWAQDVAAMVGYHGEISLAAAQLPSWQTTAQGLSAQPAGAVATALSAANSAVSSGPLGGLLGRAEHSAQAAIGQAQQAAVNAANGTAEVLVGHPLIGAAANTAAGSATGSGAAGQGTSLPSNSVPITVRDGVRPTISISVNGGPSVAALLDTGARGVVIPFTDVGGVLGLLKMGWPSGGFGVSGFANGQIQYLYGTWDMPVNLGNGIVTSPTPVQVELIAWPGSLQFAMSNGWTFQSLWGLSGVDAVFGVGPNALGPGSISPVTALPAPLNQGILINQPGGYAEFGANPLTPVATLTGAPYTTLDVRVGDGPLQPVYSNIDSGGAAGWLPSSITGGVSPGTPVIVYAPGNPTPLYNVFVGLQPVLPGTEMNTGNFAFADSPVYISNSPSGVGTTVFDAPT